MPKLTPEEKLNKQKRQNLLGLCNRIASALNFKQIKTWADVYKMEGMNPTDIVRAYPDTFMLDVTFPDLKKHFDKLKSDLEKSIAASVASPSIRETTPSDTSVTSTDTLPNPLPTVIPDKPASKIDITPKPIEVELVSADNDYGLHSSPNEKSFHFWFQKKIIKELWDAVVKHNHSSNLCLAPTGSGKTFIALALIRRLVDIGWADDKTYGHVKYLYVTRATIVEQTKRVARTFYNLGIIDGFEVLNIEQLRSRAGELWIKDEVKIINGEEHTIYSWRKLRNPALIVWDECQALKNDTSIQHKIASSFNDVDTPTFQLFVSATPFTRVSEAKCFSVSTRHKVSKNLGLMENAELNNALWPTYASAIAYPSPPTDYNEAAVERLRKDLDKYIKQVRGIRPQFDAQNSIEMIYFETPEEEKYYADTEERYIRKKRKLQQDIDAGLISGGGIWPLVLLNERCMAAELCRANHLAKKMYHAVTEGYAAVCACKYKATMIKVVQILRDKYGIDRNLISLVWGGGQTQLTTKQKMKASLKEKEEKLAAAGISMDEMLSDLELEDVEDRIIEELDPALRLGPQSREERQKEIDRFQSGKTLYCMYTFKAGGVGLSLHHTDEFTKEKVRRKANGYAVVEDIPNIPVRPRINFVAPTYSAIELVQGLGRCPRLTSLSNTIQKLIYYGGTVEVDVARIVSSKLRCVRSFVRQHESWQDVITHGVSADSHIKDVKPDDPDELVSEEEEEE